MIVALNMITATKLQNSTSSGKDFLLVGDYAYIEKMEHARQTFAAINDMVVNEKIDHFITMGDNIYPMVADDPTEEEFKKMKDLFKMENLKDLPILAIRGNHDCYYKNETWLNVFKNESQWDVPYYYYTREI